MLLGSENGLHRLNCQSPYLGFRRLGFNVLKLSHNCSKSTIRMNHFLQLHLCSTAQVAERKIVWSFADLRVVPLWDCANKPPFHLVPIQFFLNGIIRIPFLHLPFLLSLSTTAYSSQRIFCLFSTAKWRRWRLRLSCSNSGTTRPRSGISGVCLNIASKAGTASEACKCLWKPQGRGSAVHVATSGALGLR